MENTVILTHPAKAVLDQMILLAGNTENEFYLYAGDSEFTMDTPEGEKTTSGCSAFSGELNSVIDMLLRAGCIEEIYSSGFRLTQEGLHYRSIKLGVVLSFLIRSVFVPIGVSAATTLITLLITSLLR